MSNFNTDNLVPLTTPLQPGQRLLKRPDGTFLPVGVQGAGQEAPQDMSDLEFFDWYTILTNN